MTIDELVLKRIEFQTKEEIQIFPEIYELCIEKFKLDHPIRQNLHPDYVATEILSTLHYQFGYTIVVYDKKKGLEGIELYND